MISPQEFVQYLKERCWLFCSCVPCSFFQAAINCVREDTGLRYVTVPNEGSALALAAGSYLAGTPGVVMIQNSGFGNLVNPLTSLNMIYGLPALLFISGRAYGVADEPQHEVIGRTMGGVLKAMGVQGCDLPTEKATYQKALDEARRYMEETRQPFVFFVRKDTVGTYEPEKPACEDGGVKPPRACGSHGASAQNAYPLSRMDAIRIIAENFKGGEHVIATTGMPSRELFSVADRAENFYMQGSMGHAASIGLGIALTRPEKKMVVLDGDGALLMHMGVLSAVGHYKPANFFHLVLDNEAYETTGNQDTTSKTTDFCLAAKAAGYRETAEAADEAGLREKLRLLLGAKGPVLLRIKINRRPAGKVPRITTKYTSEQITANFKKTLDEKK